MSFDYDTSELVPLSRVGAIMEAHGLGTVTRQTAWLWATKGYKKYRNVDKRLKLQTIVSIGRRFTTKRWVLEFIHMCNKT